MPKIPAEYYRRKGKPLYEVTRLSCPWCGYTSPKENPLVLYRWDAEELDYWDTAGACDGQVFCPKCTGQFSPLTGKKHKRCTDCDRICG